MEENLNNMNNEHNELSINNNNDIRNSEQNINNNNDNEQQNININNNNEDIKEILEDKKAYYFSQNDLENYYKIFISLEDYLNSLTKKNTLNDIISYGDLRYTYKIGFEHIIFLLKSYPFNLLRLIYQRQYYKDVLRQFFIPYLRRAFSNISIYTYYKLKFSDVNKVLEQIYGIVFLRRLNFYGQIMQILKQESENNYSTNITNDSKQSPRKNNIVINTSNINNNKNEENNERNKKNEVNDIKMIDKGKMISFIQVLEIIYKKIIFNKILYYYSIILENKIKKNENDNSYKSNISSQRYNTYMYESFSEKSSLTAYPNSEGSARLHKVCELLEMQRKPQLEEENNFSELAENSIQSIRSLDDDKYKKRNNFDTKNNNKLNNNFNNKKDDEIKDIKNNLAISNDNNIDDKDKNINLNIKSNNLNEEIIKNELLSNDDNNKNNNDNNEKKIKDEDGLNIPYEERINNLNKNKEVFADDKPINDNKNTTHKMDLIDSDNQSEDILKDNEKNKEANELNNDNNNDNEEKNNIENDKMNLEIKYENLPRKIENEQYKKIEIKNDGNKNTNKYTGCVKKIEITNNFKINLNSQPTLEDISASKDSNLIDWEFNNSNNKNNIINSFNIINANNNENNNYINQENNNQENKEKINENIAENINEINNNNVDNKSLSNRDKSPIIDNLMNSQKKDDLFNSSEFNSNIKEGVIVENDINIIEENIKIEENKNINNINDNNKELLELNEKKSRNNNNDIIAKNEIKQKNDNNNNNKSSNNSSDIIKSSEDNNYTIGLNLSNSLKNNTNNISTVSNNSIAANDNLRYNENTELNDANINKENLNDINIKIINDDNKKEKILKKLSNDTIEKITNDLCEQIISNILLSEIKDKKKSLFKKKREINASLNNSSASLLVSQNSMSIGSHSPGRNYPNNKNINLVNNNDSYQTISSVNNSQSEAVLNNSIFMRTIDEIKKEKTLNLYNEKISPLLIKKIEDNIVKNYENIINNLKIPLKIDEAKMINGLMLKDRSLSISSKIRFCNENITNVKFVEENILNDFDKIDKEIRNNDNIITDNYYDKILNKCVYDTSNELIEKQRQYGIIGEPLPWSIRTKEIDYKYKNGDNYSKSIFVNKIIKEIKKIIDTRMGLIAENYEYLDMDQLNQDRDKKFMESITKELKDNEDYYQIFETQETYVKLSLSRIIMDQLLNEIVEILEHVQYSRKEPDKYQSKSIYACEDIPRLSFQPQTMENNYSGNLEGDGDGDESINQ